MSTWEERMSARAHARERAAAEAERARAEKEAQEEFEAQHAGHVTHTEPAPAWFKTQYGEDLEVCSCGMLLNWPMASGRPLAGALAPLLGSG